MDGSQTEQTNKAVRIRQPRQNQVQRGYGELKTCSLCNLETCGLGDLRKHYRKEHEGKVYSIVMPGNHKESIHDPKTYQCDLCGYENKWKSAFLEHKREKHGILTKVTKFSNAMNIPVTCDLCEYSTKSAKLLQNHRTKNHNQRERIFQCSLCEFKAMSDVGLKHHMLYHNYGNGRGLPIRKVRKFEYPCDICGYIAKKKLLLRKHKRAVHNIARRKFPCDICSYVARNRDNFKSHRETEHPGV